MKELNKNSHNLTSLENLNTVLKKQYYCYKTSNKQFQSKFNELLN